jgi:hypothetical protein
MYTVQIVLLPSSAKSSIPFPIVVVNTLPGREKGSKLLANIGQLANKYLDFATHEECSLLHMESWDRRKII